MITTLQSHAAEVEDALPAGEYHTTDAERAGIDCGPAGARDGRSATDEAAAAVFARHRDA